ncbi:slit homolog 2 protein-like isoform X2 [Mytilus galloprovincialis]|uniref:slit homolog 2 protein-like isoform X2 n=1 Tax=Mytilus galloprovincialis TaxID=29158 RepID=UPI003F7CC39C
MGGRHPFKYRFHWICLISLIVYLESVLGCPTECVCQGKNVDCSYRKLSYVPTNIPKDTQKLELQGNNLTIMRKNDLQGLRQLKVLQLLENQIQTIERGAFRDLVLMERLRIDRNKLDNIPDELFSEMPNLERLDLSYNKLQSINRKSLQGSLSLRNLQLDHNQIICISEESLRPLKKMEILTLNNNNLTTLPRGLFDHMTNLRILRLINNNFMCDCHLLWLPRYLRSHRGLGLYTECDSPSRLQSIEMVDIPESQFKCQGMDSYKAPKCGVEARCPSKCRCMEGVVDCRDLGLTAIPTNLPEDTIEIRMEQNHIVHIPSGAFSDMKRLRRIDLSNNQISKIDSDAFAGQLFLNSLVLYGNKIVDLPHGVFNGLSSLQLLLLNANKIKCIRKDAFKDLYNLNLLSLYDNQIQSLGNGTFVPLQNIQTLHLGRNPFICDCNLGWLVEYLIKNPIETSGARCESPRRMERKKIATAKVSKFKCAENHRTENAGNCMVDMACPDSCVCLGTVVDCSGRGLTAIPKGIPTYTTSLKLNKNKLTRIDSLSEMLTLLDGLRSIDFSNNLIDSIHDMAFDGANKLLEINLADNKLSKLSMKMLYGLRSVHTISLDKNQITCISNTTFSEMPNLRHLSLFNNQIRCVMEGAFDKQHYLARLNVEGNPFNCNCHLGWLPEWLSMRNIITGNPTCNAPHQFKDSAITDLKAKDFICEESSDRGCNIGIPPCCSDGPLESVDSCHPRAFCPPSCTCTGTVVRCSRKNLSTIPSGIPQDTTELYLDVNKITHLTTEIGSLTNLRRLDLSNNLLVTLPENIFSNCTQLTALILSYNHLECMADTTLSSLKRLRVLSLHGNNFSTIPYGAFKDLISLTHLALGGNPFYCDCNLKWLSDYIKKDYVESGIASCAGPLQMTNKLILTTDSTAFQCNTKEDSGLLSKCNACHKNPCLHDGTCQLQDFKNFTCQCTPGYYGNTCQNEINACFGNPCVNNGECSVLHHGRFQCACPNGFRGERCEENINDCVQHRCQNNATCVDGIQTYTCKCAMGFNGKHCESKIPFCQGVYNFCQNGAKCISTDNDYRCQCTKDWSGKNCSVNIDDCKTHICQNGGRCIDGVGTYNCLCSKGYTGKYCDVPPARKQFYAAAGPCQHHDCQNNAVCHPQKGNREYSCECVSGFSGKKCEKLKSVTFKAEDSYIQMSKIDFQLEVNITISLKTESKSGLIFYTGNEPHLAVELFRGRVKISFYTGDDHASTMYSYIYSFVTIDDDKIHKIQLMVQRRNITMTIDDGKPQSVINQGNNDFLNHDEDVYLGGMPQDVGQAAKDKFHTRNLASFKGCFQEVSVNGKVLDFTASIYNHKVMPGCKVDVCHNNRCKKGHCKPRKKRGGYRCKCKRGYSGKFCDIAPSCSRKVFKNIYVDPKTNCQSRTKIKFRVCEGSCGKDCCKPKKIKTRKVRLYCKNGSSYVHNLPVIRRCGCKKC